MTPIDPAKILRGRAMMTLLLVVLFAGCRNGTQDWCVASIRELQGQRLETLQDANKLRTDLEAERGERRELCKWVTQLQKAQNCANGQAKRFDERIDAIEKRNADLDIENKKLDADWDDWRAEFAKWKARQPKKSYGSSGGHR